MWSDGNSLEMCHGYSGLRVWEVVFAARNLPICSAYFAIHFTLISKVILAEFAHIFAHLQQH
jgi:hypothetical protein